MSFRVGVAVSCPEALPGAARLAQWTKCGESRRLSPQLWTICAPGAKLQPGYAKGFRGRAKRKWDYVETMGNTPCLRASKVSVL